MSQIPYPDCLDEVMVELQDKVMSDIQESIEAIPPNEVPGHASLGVIKAARAMDVLNKRMTEVQSACQLHSGSGTQNELFVDMLMEYMLWMRGALATWRMVHTVEVSEYRSRVQARVGRREAQASSNLEYGPDEERA